MRSHATRMLSGMALVFSLALPASVLLTAPASAQIPDAPTLLTSLGFSPDEVQQVMSGQIVRGEHAGRQPSRARRGHGVPGARLAKEFVSQLKSGLGVQVDPSTLGTGTFTGAGSPADLSKLTLDPDARTARRTT